MQHEYADERTYYDLLEVHTLKPSPNSALKLSLLLVTFICGSSMWKPYWGIATTNFGADHYSTGDERLKICADILRATRVFLSLWKYFFSTVTWESVFSVKSARFLHQAENHKLKYLTKISRGRYLSRQLSRDTLFKIFSSLRIQQLAGYLVKMTDTLSIRYCTVFLELDYGDLCCFWPR